MAARISRRRSRRRYFSWSSWRSARSASGRCLGRPTVPATAVPLSSSGSSWVMPLGFPPFSDAARGMPWPSVRTWCVRGRPGWGRFRAAPSGPDVGGAGHRPGPVELLRGPQLVRQHRVQCAPDSGFVPGGQAPPARHPRAEAQLLGQVLPLDAGVRHEQDSAQCLPVRDPRPALHLLRSRLGQQPARCACPPGQHAPRRPALTARTPLRRDVRLGRYRTRSRSAWAADCRG